MWHTTKSKSGNIQCFETACFYVRLTTRLGVTLAIIKIFNAVVHHHHHHHHHHRHRFFIVSLLLETFHSKLNKIK